MKQDYYSPYQNVYGGRQQPSYSYGFPPGYTTGGPIPQTGPSTAGPPKSPYSNIPGMLPLEESYIENILRLNRGKPVTVYMTFENNKEWNAMTFRGIIEAAGRDHIILSDPETGKRYLLLMIYLDYVVFDEEVNYDLPY
ncbi:spore coat protein GerQ [Bacillus solimangrovi]|nr:spore coat protein GerQ [Bacillus solimangrovi]